MQALYTAQASATGGRIGRAVSSDNSFDLELSTPKQLGGPGGSGTNPEQLFAAGYAACFLSALKLVARMQKIAVGDDASVTADVGIGSNGQGGYALSAKLVVSLPGVPAEQAQALVNKAHEVCPYSNATRGNMPVELSLA